MTKVCLTFFLIIIGTISLFCNTYYVSNDGNNAFGYGSLDNHWDKIKKIQAEDWTYIAQEDPRGGITLPSAKIRDLHYGHGYIVTLKPGVEAFDFSWHSDGIAREKESEKTSEYFVVNEKPDYEVIDVLDIDPSIQEIGVYQENECVGAVVVDEESEQILVYSNDANRNNTPFEFEVITEGNRGSESVSYERLNLDTYEYSSRQVVPGKQEYSVVKFNKLEDNQQNESEMKLFRNYPNPFNPSSAGRSPTTTICFQIPLEQSVNLSVFNLKGQKVKTLCKDVMNSGIHRITWNGDNDNGKPVASGMYFYKLETKNKTLTNKMLLLK